LIDEQDTAGVYPDVSVSALGMTAGALAVARRSLLARIRAESIRTNLTSGTATHLMLAFLLFHDELLHQRWVHESSPLANADDFALNVTHLAPPLLHRLLQNGGFSC
jgi:hypothetical protein